MSATRPLLVLLIASLLLALPVPGASAGASTGKKHAKHHKHASAKKHRRHKKRKHAKKHKRPRPAAKHVDPQPAVSDDDLIEPTGTVSAIDGALVTVTLTKGGVLTALVTDDSSVVCAHAPDADDDGVDDESDDADDAPGDGDDEGDDPDARSASLAVPDCTVAVGDLVYDAEIEDGVFDLLDLSGA